MKYNRLLKKAEKYENFIKKAKKSICKTKIIAIGLDKKRNIIHACTNLPRYSKKGGGIHAEERMMREAGKKLKYIIIMRGGRSGTILPIEACERCSKLAEKNLVKIVPINFS